MMNRVSAILAAIVCLIICVQVHAKTSTSDQPSQMSLGGEIASKVQYMHDQEKLALDLNWEFLYMWDDPVFLSLGAYERGHMDELLTLMQANGLDPLVSTLTEGEYGASDHRAAYIQLHSQGGSSLLEAYLATAYVEEWDITELRAIMNSTDEPSLINMLERLLAGAERHLQMLVSRINGLGHEYQAQMLSQLDVDEICSGVEPYTDTDFTLNSGLNDSWYYPFTSGQGFFVTVYPDLETVVVFWAVYDTYLPGEDVQSTLGDAGQRWLIAHGPFAGNRAELKVYSASGGLFDTVGAKPELEDIGQMLLQFDDCLSGSIRYTLWPLWGGYFMPIERIAPDNVAECELKTQP